MTSSCTRKPLHRSTPVSSRLLALIGVRLVMHWNVRVPRFRWRILLQHLKYPKHLQIRSGGRQAYVQRFDDQYGDVLAIARVDPRAKIFIELAGLSPYDYIPRVKTTSRVHITAGGIRHDLLEQAQTLSEEQLQNIEGSFRLSEEIAHQGIATATPSFSQRLQSFGYSLVSPDTTPNRNLFDRE